MCGQFGIVTKAANARADDFVSDAFITSTLRGEDSSGIVTIDPYKNDYMLQKLPVSGQHFVTDRVAKRYIGYAAAAKTITLCHVRAATQGSVTLSNAHPFEIEEGDNALVGTHNGTLNGWSQKKGGKHFDVDSEWALWRISVDGLDAFKDFTGAFSFVWWNSKDPENVFMARNKDRPLAVAFLKDGGMAYASEAGMLYWLLERNSLQIDGDILFTDVDKMYKFPVANPKEFTTEELPAVSYTFSSGAYSQNRSYSLTTVDKVNLLVAAIAAETTSNTTDATRDKDFFPLAFESEMKLAKDYGWSGEDAEFTPLEVDSAGNTIGLCEVCNVEFDAMVRGDYRATLDYKGVWKCKVLGVHEEGKDMVMVLSKPSAVVDYYAASLEEM